MRLVPIFLAGALVAGSALAAEDAYVDAASARKDGSDDHLVLSSPRIRSAQQRLARRGYHPGQIDGRMGPSTRAALRSFQQHRNLPATGRFDRETLSALGLS